MRIPIMTISGDTIDGLLIYLSILGILILVATILRLKIPLLKKYYIPASLLAGIIGLILGPYFIGVIPTEITSTWSNLSGKLIVLVFAPMLMGKGKKTEGGSRVCKEGGQLGLLVLSGLFCPVRSAAFDGGVYPGPGVPCA